MAERDAAVEVGHILRIRHPMFPASRKVPFPIRRLLPDPLRDWDRLTHADIPRLSNEERHRELFRLRVGLAQVDRLEAVPDWIHDRIRLLSESLGSLNLSRPPAAAAHRAPRDRAPAAKAMPHLISLEDLNDASGPTS